VKKINGVLLLSVLCVVQLNGMWFHPVWALQGGRKEREEREEGLLSADEEERIIEEEQRAVSILNKLSAGIGEETKKRKEQEEYNFAALESFIKRETLGRNRIFDLSSLERYIRQALPGIHP